MVDEKKILVRKMYKNKIFFSIFMSFLLDKLHRGGLKSVYRLLLQPGQVFLSVPAARFLCRFF